MFGFGWFFSCVWFGKSVRSDASRFFLCVPKSVVFYTISGYCTAAWLAVPIGCGYRRTHPRLKCCLIV